MVRAAGWLVAAALVAGCASDNSIGGSSHIGKVQGVYVEQYSGIFVDRNMAASDAGKPVWVYVTFDRALADGSRFATAVLEQDPGVETGDLVQLRFAHDGEPQPGATPAHNQVTALIAKHDTARARAFGSAPTVAIQALTQAAADPRP
jgi:hypothetical protein